MGQSAGEAEKLIEQALKYEKNKTMLFKKSPEWEKAADAYQKAAQMFRSPLVKNFDRAVEAFSKAAEMHVGAGAHYSAGVAMDNAGNVLRDNGGADKCAKYYGFAADHYMNGINPEKAAESHIKCAKAMAEAKPDKAIEHYLEAINIYESEDRHIFISDTWRGCLALMMRHNKVEQSITLLERMQQVFEKLEQPEYLRKAQLSVIVLHLSKGDCVAAGGCRDSYDDFVLSKEGAAASELIELFEEGEDEKVKELCGSQTFTLLENQIARAAAKLADVCREAANDMTGAGIKKSKGANVVHLDELDAGGGGGGGGGDDEDLC